MKRILIATVMLALVAGCRSTSNSSPCCNKAPVAACPTGACPPGTMPVLPPQLPPPARF